MRIIAGKARGTKLFTLEGNQTRPTLDRVKESVFQMIQPWIYDAEALDLFSGTGAIGLELLSRGAKNVWMNDMRHQAVEVMKKNQKKLSITPSPIISKKDALLFLAQESKTFDIIYLDPPFDYPALQEVFDHIAKFQRLKNSGMIILETDAKTKLPQTNLSIVKQKKYGRIRITIYCEGKDESSSISGEL